MNRTPTYQVWQNMKARCTNKNLPRYPRYGGRGIRVCERWLSYENFLADMGEKPHGMSIDRIDNDGDYAPENCRWADKRIQNANKSTNVYLEHNGERLCITDWAERLGVNPRSLKHRLDRGWPVSSILNPFGLLQNGGRSGKPGRVPKSQGGYFIRNLRADFPKEEK